MIAVFAYDFPHRKTHDFLLELAAAGFRDVLVLAAPWRALGQPDRTVHIPKRLRTAAPLATEALCTSLGFRHATVDHRESETVRALLAEHGISFGVISGARILKRAVIESCPDGLVNIHPGPLPETSGLDALFYTIAKGVPAGVTTHLIDARVDAGARLFFDELRVGPDDPIEIVQANLYQLQIVALRRVLESWRAATLRCEPIDRPSRNAPMTPDEKRAALSAFPAWRAAQWLRGLRRDLFAACEAGETGRALRLLGQMPELIETRTPEGWTPLIVAAFHQHYDLAQALLDRGADPNATGRKGTTVLMYAKTALLGRDRPDTRLLDLLLARGADPGRRDMHGRGLLDYIDPDADAWLVDFLQAKEAV